VVGPERVLEAGVRRARVHQKGQAELAHVAQPLEGRRLDQLAGERVEADVEYVENWSFWLDMVILWRTCWQGLRGRRAPGSKVDPGV
jgi:lipopolysaccharide/colanic/teichoic acid biosynthesis glycosyltransferase